MVDQRHVDALLDEYTRLRRALEVLHAESDTDLPFDNWVELVAVRKEVPDAAA